MQKKRDLRQKHEAELRDKLEAQVALLQQEVEVGRKKRINAEGELANCRAVLRHLKVARRQPGDDLILAALKVK